MLLSSRLPGVELRYSRLSDARGIAQLLRLRDVMEEEDEGGIPTSAMMKAAGVQDAEDVVDLIQTSFLAITATVRVADQETGSPCATEEGDHVAVVNENGAPAATRQVVAGFLALGTGPRVYSDAAPLSRPSTTDGPAADSKQTYQFPPDRWDDMMRSGVYAGKGVDNIQPSNTLWTSLCVAPSSTTTQAQAAYTGCDNGAVRWSTDRAGESGNVCYSPARLIEEMLTVALSVSSRTSHVLWPLPPDPSAAATEAMLKTSLSADVVPLSLSGVRPAGLTFTGTLLHIRREGVIPALATRPGRIEDYDDFVPLLVRGAGVLTELPEDFFLEEVLKDQDALHKVAIAENPVTHEVVGLICAHVLAPEELQYFTKQYALEPFNKLRPSGGVFVGGSSSSGSKAARDGAAGGCTVRLDFVYFDDRYNGSAHELVRYLLETVFPTCEYLVLTLPHAQLETPLLRDFTYIPIRHYQPHNSRGEFVPVPPGLWVCGRHSTLHVEEFRVRVIATSEERALVEQLLATPNLPNLKQDVAEKLQEDLCVSHEAEHIEQRSAVMRLPPTAVFQLTAPSGETIGLVSARRMRGRDLYALEANYNLDEYLSLYTHTGRDYTATELDDGGNKGSGGTKDCAQAPKRRRRVFPELTAVMLRAVYVKPSFRSWTRFLVREVLRRYVADIACTLTSLGEEPCVALMRELVPAKPRRVVEIEPGGGDLDDDVDEDIGESDEHGAMKTAASSTNTNTREATGNVVTLAALHFTTARFLGDEKRRIHARVVVVGASATGIGFLHALLTTPFAVFTNLVLVSTDGLPPHPNQEPALWRADHLELFEREYLSLQQGSPVRVVPGALVDLDKVNRFVSVDNGSFEPYDYLILAAGRQYVLPLSIRQLLQQEGRTGKKSVIPLNGDLALDRVRQALADIDCNPNNVANVMVYGSGLDALAVAAAMIQERFSSQRVIVCARDAALPPHMDESTYQATSSLFRALGVNVFRGYDVSRMEFDDENNLSSVLLAPVSPETKAGQSVELACCLVVCVEDKDIDANVLSALNKRSIVFDGRVIVNRRYRTTDPRVFAAGPVAMWTRRYGTATPNFEDFSAKDVGSHLAQVLLGHLGFHEFLKLAALSAKRARMTQLQGDTLAHDPAEDIEEAEDDEDDSDWNNANTTTIPNAASAADGLTFNGTCGTDSGRVGSSSRGGSGFKRMSFRSNNNADRSAVSRQLRKKLPTYVTPIARRLRLPSGYHYFSVEAVDARLNDQCEALRCDTVDPSRFSDGEFSPSKHDLAEAAKDENTDHANSSRRPPTGSRQSVVTVYVNRSTRRIDGITYFGLEEPPTGNLRALVGLPETLLNLTFRVKEAQERAAAASRLSEGEHTACPVDEVNLPAHSGLTAGVRRGQLDLLEYLRLPHLQTIFYDRFTDFFRVLEYRTRAHEEAMQLRERILAQHKLDNSLTPEQIAAYQAEMTAKKSGFRYEVQLALLSFLHEHKNFRPNSLYLPNIERVIAAKKARNKSGSHGVTVDPTTTVR